MSPLTHPRPLTGKSVVLEPLGEEHLAALVVAANEDRSSYQWTTVPDGPAAMQRYIDTLLRQAAEGEVIPFVQRSTAFDRVVGCTRYMDFHRWSGRPQPDEVEVGGTWLAASAQRGPINTEAKLLLLTHAFETWSCVRVAICTDARNTRSRTAIERIGATFEGVLRNHRSSHVVSEAGRPRDTAVFSITSDEWPRVKDHLTALRDR